MPNNLTHLSQAKAKHFYFPKEIHERTKLNADAVILPHSFDEYTVRKVWKNELQFHNGSSITKRPPPTLNKCSNYMPYEQVPPAAFPLVCCSIIRIP